MTVDTKSKYSSFFKKVGPTRRVETRSRNRSYSRSSHGMPNMDATPKCKEQQRRRLAKDLREKLAMLIMP